MSADTPLDIHLKYMNEKFGHLEKRLDGLATSDEVTAVRSEIAAVSSEVAAVKSEVDKIIPWMNTLSTLERVAKWAVVIAAGVGVVVAAIKGIGK